MPAALEEQLTGRLIALPETRELDLFANMLERRGASTLRCPLVSILDTPDAQPVKAWLQRCISGEYDDLILLTGEGLRRLLGFADRSGMRAAFVHSLQDIRKITRGPKPARALREIGLRPDIPAEVPTTDGVIAALEKENLRDRRVGVQLYGNEPNQKLVDFLVNAGACPSTVAPYVYADAAEDTHVAELIRRIVISEVDAIAFTSSPQVRRLLSVAQAIGQDSALRAGLNKTKVASIGPVVTEVLQQAGIRVDLMPADSFFLKPLVNELAAALGPAERGY